MRTGQIENGLRPVRVSRDVQAFLKSMLGKQLQVRVVQADVGGKHVMLSAAGHKFEALLQGRSFKPGDIVQAQVKQLDSGMMQLLVLKDATPVLLDIQTSLQSFPKGLAQFLSLFLFSRTGAAVDEKTRKQAEQNLKEVIKWLEPLVKNLQKAGFAKTPLSQLLTELAAVISEGKQIPECSFQESWFVSPEGQPEQQEAWQMFAVGHMSTTPCHYFFQVEAGFAGRISGAFVSSELDFSKLHIYLRASSPTTASYLNQKTEEYRTKMAEAGIEIVEFHVLSEVPESGLDLQV